MPLYRTTRTCQCCNGPLILRRPSDPKIYCSPECYYVHRRTAERISKRFWPKVDMSGDCWLWTGPVDQDGYGMFFGEGFRRAHRCSYILAHGFIPEGLLVCHTCDTPACVRPDHLFVGTSAENNQDRSRKGRTAHGPQPYSPNRLRGARNPNSRLTAEAAREIKQRLRGGGVSKAQLARDYGVSEGAIYAILNGRSWQE